MGCGVLAGKELVIWRDAEGQWRCFQDKCPHRCARRQRILILTYTQNPNLSAVLACREEPEVHSGCLLHVLLMDLSWHLPPSLLFVLVLRAPLSYVIPGRGGTERQKCVVGLRQVGATL